MRHLTIFVMAAILGRAVWFSNISPHGVAAFAACWTAWPAERWAVLLGVLVGSVTKRDPTAFIRVGTALLCTAAILAACEVRKRRARTSGYKTESIRKGRRRREKRAGGNGDPGIDMVWPSVAAIVSLGSVSLVQAALRVTSPRQLVVWATESLASGLLAALLLPGIAYARQLSQGKVVPPSAGAAEATSTGVLLVSLFCGLGQIRLLGVSLREAGSTMITMVAAFAAGPGAGTVTGLLSGMVPLLEGSKIATAAARYAFGGLVAGAFKSAGKIGVAVSYILAAGMVSVYSGSIAETSEGVVAMILGALAFFTLPGVLVETLSLAVPASRPVSADFLKVREEKIKEELISRVKGLSLLMRELSRTYEQIAVGVDEAAELVPPAFADLVCKVCQECGNYRSCWEVGFFRTYRSFLDLLAIGENSGGLVIDEVPDDIRSVCKRLPELIAAVNYVVELNRINTNWKERLRESRVALVSQAKGIASAMDQLVFELRSDEEGQRETAGSTPKYATGVARLTRAGGLVSGDYHLVRELSGGRVLLVLSDGMGSGPKAAMEARSMVALLEKMLEAGFDRESALHTVNSIMVMRSRDETFATLDMAILNLQTSEADFMKVGAAPSFLKRGSEVTVIKSHTLPMGVVSHIEVETIQKLLVTGDILVMATDGVVNSKKHSSDSSEQWVCSFLSRLRCEDPEEIARRLVEKAVDNWRRAGVRDVPDDMTVLVTKLGL